MSKLGERSTASPRSLRRTRSSGFIGVASSPGGGYTGAARRATDGRRRYNPPMFETAELGRSVGKEEFEAEVPKLRLELLEAQRDLQKAGVPVIVLLAGADGAGKGETVKRVLEWLDTRGLDTHAFGPPTDEERERPRWWRYWMRLPPRGRIGIFFGSWYSEPLVERAFSRLSRARYDRMLGEIAFFEQMLAEDGALVVKLWIHLSKKGLRKRMRRLEADPATRWKITRADWKHFKKYDRFIEASEHAIRSTDTSHAPWLLVEASDERYRDLMAGRTLLERFRTRLAETPPGRAAAPAGSPAPPPAMSKEASLTILDRVNLKQKLDPAEYARRLEKAQGKLGRL